MEYFDTHQIKQRGWTATMIAKLLPRHDATRPNNLVVGRSRSYVAAPVKLYAVARVEEAETTEDFLIAQAVATKAREAGLKGKGKAAQHTAMVTADYVAKHPDQLTPPAGAEQMQWRQLWNHHLDVLMRWENENDGPLWDLTPKARQHARLLVHEKMRELFREQYPHVFRTPATEDVLP